MRNKNVYTDGEIDEVRIIQRANAQCSKDNRRARLEKSARVQSQPIERKIDQTGDGHCQQAHQRE